MVECKNNIQQLAEPFKLRILDKINHDKTMSGVVLFLIFCVFCPGSVYLPEIFTGICS